MEVITRLQLFVLSLILVLGCNTARIEQKDDLSFEQMGEIFIRPSEEYTVLEIDQFSKTRNPIRGITDQREYYFFNSFNHAIYIYDIDSKIQVPKEVIKVPLDEAVNFFEVSDIFYHNADSIFIWDDTHSLGDLPELFLINRRGELINTFKVLNPDGGYPDKATLDDTLLGWSMVYHRGKILLLSKITRYTKEENWKPIMIYNLQSQALTLHGSYPKSFYPGAFGQFRWMSNFCLMPELNQVVVSFPFESNLFFFDLTSNDWNEIVFETDLVAEPNVFDSNTQSPKDYVESNSWYFGLDYDQANGLIWRTAEVGSYPRTASSAKTKYKNFLIDPKTRQFWTTSGINWWDIAFFDPKYGPFLMVNRYDDLGLDPENYVILNQITPAFENN